MESGTDVTEGPTDAHLNHLPDIPTATLCLALTQATPLSWCWEASTTEQNDVFFYTRLGAYRKFDLLTPIVLTSTPLR